MKNEDKRAVGSAAMLFTVERSVFMAGPIRGQTETVPDREYACNGYVRVDEDPTVMIILKPFARANKVPA